MNTEKLYTVALAIQKDINDTGLIALINNMVNSLQNQISQPQQPQYQQQLSTFMQQLSQQLKAAKSNKFSPLWKQILEELGVEDILGDQLDTNITEIFEHNKITLAHAHTQLKEIQSKLNSKKAAIDQLIASFVSLGIETEELLPGECEVGILIPRLYVDNKLPAFGRELEELQSIFAVYEEITTGSRAGFILKSISSSEFGVFLQTSSEIAACVAVATERILALYKTHLEIKKLHNELKKQSVPQANLDGIAEHLNSLISSGIKVAAKEIVNERSVKSLDAGRRNELETELNFSMNKIANRIDRGFNFEVRAEPATLKEPGEATQAQVYYEEIVSRAENLGFIKTDGPPVLSLPESKDS